MTLLARKTRTTRNPRPNLERQAIFFTIALYLFISAALLAVHYLAPEAPAGSGGSSSTSPFNP